MTPSTDVLPMVAPAEGVSGPPQGQWTYDDYAAMPADGKRYELIRGVLYMTPAPITRHQKAVGAISYYLYQHVQVRGLGSVFAAPYDVELAPGTVVQPDVVVALKKNEGIITPTRIIGTPDLLVEVISPSSANYDRREKFDAYQDAGVREYWIADPAPRTVDLLALQQDGSYRLEGVFHGEGRLPSRVLPDFSIPVDKLLG